MTESISKATRHSFIHALGKGISTVLGVVAIALITRYLGPDGFGQYTKIMAFLQFFGIFVDMGLSLVLIQLISNPAYEEEKIISNVMTLRFTSALIFLGLAPVIVMFFPYQQVVKEAVAIGAFSFLFIALTQVLTGLYQKHLQMQSVVIAEVLGRIALIASIAIVLFYDWGLLALMWAVVLASFIHFAILFLQSKQFVKMTFAFDKEIWKLIFQKTWPIALSIIFNLIYLKADIIILSLFHSDAEVGIYGAAYRVIEVLTVIPMLFMGMMLPLLTNAFAKNDTEDFQSTLQHSLNVMSILIFPIVFGAFVVGNKLMAVIAGQEFFVSGEPLKIIILGLAAIFIGSIFAHAVVAIDKQRKMIAAYALTALIAFGLYLVFIPPYSYTGAAIVTVVSEVLIAIISYIVIKRYTKISLSLLIPRKALIGTLIMTVILYAINNVTVWITIPLGALIYFFSLWAMKVITPAFISKLVKST